LEDFKNAHYRNTNPLQVKETVFQILQAGWLIRTEQLFQNNVPWVGSVPASPDLSFAQQELIMMNPIIWGAQQIVNPALQENTVIMDRFREIVMLVLCVMDGRQDQRKSYSLVHQDIIAQQA